MEVPAEETRRPKEDGPPSHRNNSSLHRRLGAQGLKKEHRSIRGSNVHRHNRPDDERALAFGRFRLEATSLGPRLTGRKLKPKATAKSESCAI